MGERSEPDYNHKLLNQLYAPKSIQTKPTNSNKPKDPTHNMRYSARFARRKPQKQTTTNNKKLLYKARFARSKPQKTTI